MRNHCGAEKINYESTSSLTLLEPHSHVWGQNPLIMSSLSPKRDWGPKRVKIDSVLVFSTLVRTVFSIVGRKQTIRHSHINLTYRSWWLRLRQVMEEKKERASILVSFLRPAARDSETRARENTRRRPARATVEESGRKSTHEGGGAGAKASGVPHKVQDKIGILGFAHSGRAEFIYLVYIYVRGPVLHTTAKQRLFSKTLPSF